MKQLFLLSFLLNISFFSFSQDIYSLFISLPTELTGLTLAQKEFVLTHGIYEEPCEEIGFETVFTLDESDPAHQFMSVSWKYHSGQSEWIHYQYRIFESDDRKILVCSSTQGSMYFYFQREFKLFEVDSLSTLTEIMPDWKIQDQDFFKKDIPPEYLDPQNELFCFNYDLRPSEFPQGIGYTAGPCYMIEREFEKWQKRTAFSLDWTGESFLLQPE